MTKVRISGSIASETGITLFLEDGNEINLPKEGQRTKLIMEEIVASLAKQEVVTIDLDSYSVEKIIEKKSKGLLRFIKETFSPLTGWTSSETVNLGTLARPVAAPKVVETAYASRQPVAGQIRTVALVGGTRVENVDLIEKQMEHAAYGTGYKGFETFMKRLATVVDQRKHTAEELLNFMRRGDLPIADDGSIVAYKVLKTSELGIVDCHSGRVVQKLGSRVSMPVSHVDDSKRTECSTGLHIARRGYLRNFSGNVITLVKVAPEDVVAVPFNEPDKMRAAAYHIVAMLPERVHQTLRDNRPMTGDKEASQMLADVIAGNHVGVLEEVVIGGAKGTNLAIKPIENAAPAPVLTLVNGEAKALDDASVPSVDLRDLRKQVQAVEAAALVPAEIATATSAASSATEAKETAQERRNRVKRERRAAARDQKVVTRTVEVLKAVIPAPGVAVALTEKELAVLAGHTAGKSLRTLEKELGMCRKTMRKIIDKHAPEKKDAAE